MSTRDDQPSTPKVVVLNSLNRNAQRVGSKLTNRHSEGLSFARKLFYSLPAVEGEDPLLVRQCGKYQIAWNERGRTTECGWFIEDGRVVSFYSIRRGE